MSRWAAAWLLLLAACGDSATTTLPPPTTAAAVTTTTDTPGTTAPPTPETTTARPLPCCDEPPALVIAGPDGILGGDGTPVVGPAQGGEWVTAVPDGAGGIVYAGVGQDVAQIMWWWPAAATEPVLVSFKPGRVLHDAAVIDGVPTAVVVDDPDPSPDSPPEANLQLLPLPDGEPRVVAALAPEAVAQVSFAAGRFVVAENVDGCATVRAVDLAGRPVDLELPAVDCAATVTGAALGPDGEQVVYARLEVDAAGEPTDVALVTAGLTAGLGRFSLGTDVGATGAVDFDGRWAIITQAFDPATGTRSALQVDLRSGEPLPSMVGPAGSSFRILDGPLEIEAE